MALHKLKDNLINRKAQVYALSRGHGIQAAAYAICGRHLVHSTHAMQNLTCHADFLLYAMHTHEME